MSKSKTNINQSDRTEHAFVQSLQSNSPSNDDEFGRFNSDAKNCNCEGKYVDELASSLSQANLEDNSDFSVPNIDLLKDEVRHTKLLAEATDDSKNEITNNDNEKDSGIGAVIYSRNDYIHKNSQQRGWRRNRNRGRNGNSFEAKKDAEIFVDCPHCGVSVWVTQLNCKIFRCGAYKDTLRPINPHMPKHACERLVNQDMIYGCGKPFKVIKNQEEIFIAIECAYI